MQALWDQHLVNRDPEKIVPHGQEEEQRPLLWP